MSRATEELLASLHGLLTQEFIRKISSGEASSADLSAAAKFLKDNGIDCVARDNEGIQSLAEAMSFPVDVSERSH
ncbi:hypothetical protein [Shimia sp.]|uniref:hypothetical protein n=1 Tax=Shimia sp. TaxID=1954381 RepID=UPI003BACEDF1